MTGKAKTGTSYSVCTLSLPANVNMNKKNLYHPYIQNEDASGLKLVWALGICIGL